MSTRYEDKQDDREKNRGLRRDVRETGRNIRDAGGDIMSNWCGLWGNLLASFGDALAPRSRTSRSATRSDDELEDDSRRSFACGNGEFRISCGPTSATDSEDKDDDTAERGSRASARYADRDRNIEIEKTS